jgi:hypothetical protein
MQEIPDSFLALYRDARGRLRESASAVFSRYDWCEDLALQVSETARALALSLGGGEADILARLREGLVGDGLEASGAGVSPEEAWWIEVRVAEMLNWPHPDLPVAPAAQTTPRTPRGRA